LQNIAGVVVVVVREPVLGSIPRKGAPEMGNQLQLWHNRARVIWAVEQMRLCFSLSNFVLISDMGNSGDNGQNYGASMFDRVRDSERQRRINGGLC
jgi:hypothetical protein